eukprot:364512-Chlamydomonas_euryale.AAC.8
MAGNKRGRQQAGGNDSKNDPILARRVPLGSSFHVDHGAAFILGNHEPELFKTITNQSCSTRAVQNNHEPELFKK